MMLGNSYEIAPELNVVQKPGSSSQTPQTSRGHHRDARSDRDGLSPVLEEEYLSQYDWPDLPPLHHIRDAMVRRRVSAGINYLLPVQKTNNSLGVGFRTDLRVMFKQEYLRDADIHDGNHIARLARFHFDPRSHPDVNRPRELVPDHRGPINQLSQRVHQRYTMSAPSRGLAGRNSRPELLRTRSSLYTPVQQIIPPEAQKLKDEAQRILSSVQASQEPQRILEPQEEPTHQKKKSVVVKQERQTLGLRPTQSRVSSSSSGRELHSSLRSPGSFQTYEEFKYLPVPTKRVLPAHYKSGYLSESASERVWDWMNSGEKVTDFSHFLDVCS